MGRVLKVIGIVVVALIAMVGLAALGARYVYGPLGPLAGPALSGPVSPQPAAGWDFVDEVPVIRLETRPGAPYTVFTWVNRVGDSIYVFGSPDSTWVAYALEDPRVRVGIRDQIYERSAVNVESLEAKRRFLTRVREKYGDSPAFPPERYNAAYETGAFTLLRLDPRDAS